MRGIQIAADYYQKRGNDVISFLPQHYATKKPPSGAFKLQEFLPLADDLPLLEELVEEGIIVLTPAQVCMPIMATLKDTWRIYCTYLYTGL